MREIVKFILWQWRKFEGWQKMFIFSMFLQGAALPMGEPWGVYVSGAGLVIVLAYFFKWAVWDALGASWKKYKEERNKIFNVIKDS
jgi:hypothetical protein